MLQEAAAAPVQAPAARKGQPCAECCSLFLPKHPSQLFCCTRHRDDFHNRMTVRGRQLTPLSLAARITRNGSRRDTVTGKRARRMREQLEDKWIVEDRDAGRMAMDVYLQRRLARGFDLP